MLDRSLPGPSWLMFGDRRQVVVCRDTAARVATDADILATVLLCADGVVRQGLVDLRVVVVMGSLGKRVCRASSFASIALAADTGGAW